MPSLRHIHLPVRPRGVATTTVGDGTFAAPPRFPTYALATELQSRLQQNLQSWKSANAAAANAASKSAPSPPPRPAIISFTPAPTFTLGRRQAAMPLTADQEAGMRAPLVFGSPSPLATAMRSAEPSSNSNFALRPTVVHAPRGGLATYHGPGQVVLWPVLDLRSPLLAARPTPLTARDYACLLEKTTIATLGRGAFGGLRGFTTENPGVWVKGIGDQGINEDRKIAAMGVHLRRHVTGLGVAINYATPAYRGGQVAMQSEDARSNPWARIVPCGLGELGVTSVQAERPDLALPETIGKKIAAAWSREFTQRLGLQQEDTDPSVEDCEWSAIKAELGLHDEDGYVEAQLASGDSTE